MGNIAIFAPVLVPTLNRCDHIKRLVNSFLECPEADNTELIIGLDYPPSEKYIEGWEKNKKYLASLSGKNNIKVIEFNENQGQERNIIKLVDYAYGQGYDSYIITEDDCEFSPNFLNYINWGLKTFKDNKKIFSICGYNYPIETTGYNGSFYFSHNFSAWGYGMWSDRFNYCQEKIFNMSFCKSIVLNPLKAFKLIKKRGLAIYRSLLHCYTKKIVYDDTFITSYQHICDMYSVFPKTSVVRNWGHDGSGLHCNDMASDIYKNQPIDNSNSFIPIGSMQVLEDKVLRERLMKYFDANNLHVTHHLKKIFRI